MNSPNGTQKCAYQITTSGRQRRPPLPIGDGFSSDASGLLRQVLAARGRKSPFSSGSDHYHRESNAAYGRTVAADGFRRTEMALGGFRYGSGDEG
jgi:hypothetical protein